MKSNGEFGKSSGFHVINIQKIVPDFLFIINGDDIDKGLQF